MPAKRGAKTRFSRPMLVTMKEMSDRGLTQAEIATALNVSQQSVSRQLAKIAASGNPALQPDLSDPVAFVAQAEKGLPCLIALNRHYATIAAEDGAQDWRDGGLEAYRKKFRNGT